MGDKGGTNKDNQASIAMDRAPCQHKVRRGESKYRIPGGERGQRLSWVEPPSPPRNPINGLAMEWHVVHAARTTDDMICRN